MKTLLLILFFPIFAHAQVYTWINEQGIRVYGDEPPANADKAQLPNLQEIKMPKVVQKEESSEQPASGVFKGYELLEIISPKEDHMITSGHAGKATIQLHIQPELQPKHQITLLLNGQPIETGAQLQFQLDNLNRGSHLLQVQIKDQGRLLISSPKRRIHVQRPSILNRPRT
ncbi:MAG: hypothetical protein CL679_09445 [Bermanella sp.]|nr:hypothetical protein [Bermanella sp.]|tara:strand:- start:2990 stop:3505 length:516 start_codon:yes stop_codon:yes gene_type:complete